MSRTRAPVRGGLLVLALLWCCCLLPTFLGVFGEEEKKGPPSKPEDGQAEEKQEVDWKELAYQKQQERIMNRKRKAQPNYKETQEERKVRLRKLAMWNAAQKKGMTDVVGRQETTVDIKVTLLKPLGIEFEKFDEEPNRAWVSGIYKDGSAYRNGEIEAGDFLSFVNGKEVDGQPYEDAIQSIIDAEGEVNLVFKRIFSSG